MAKRKVMFTYPKEVISEPVIYTLSRDFSLATNIIQAHITSDRGWIIMEIEGQDKDIDAGIAWATSRGIRVEPA